MTGMASAVQGEIPRITGEGAGRGPIAPDKASDAVSSVEISKL